MWGTGRAAGEAKVEKWFLKVRVVFLSLPPCGV